MDSLEGDDYDVGRRVLKGWPLESLNRPHPCETLGDAAAALDGWAGDSADDAGAAGALGNSDGEDLRLAFGVARQHEAQRRIIGRFRFSRSRRYRATRAWV